MKKQYFFTGSYASESEESICLWELDTSSGKISKLEALTGYLNPSYLITGNDSRNLYAVSEFDGAGEVFSFALDENARPEFLNKLPIKGEVACHLALSDKLLVIANYMSGSLSLLLLDKNGALKEVVGEVVNQPSGGQAHYVLFCEEYPGKLLVADLGLDKVFTYQADLKTGKLNEILNEGISLPKGSGPRHLVRHPKKSDLVYVISEYSADIHVLKTGVEPQILQSISALPENCAIENTAAAIRISADGKFLYSSNRGFDSIAVFQVDQDGLLSLVDIKKVSGSCTRDFCLFDDFAVVAYQESDLLEVFKIDADTGMLNETGIKAEMISPICICPVNI